MLLSLWFCWRVNFIIRLRDLRAAKSQKFLNISPYRVRLLDNLMVSSSFRTIFKAQRTIMYLVRRTTMYQTQRTINPRSRFERFLPIDLIYCIQLEGPFIRLEGPLTLTVSLKDSSISTLSLNISFINSINGLSLKINNTFLLPSCASCKRIQFCLYRKSFNLPIFLFLFLSVLLTLPPLDNNMQDMPCDMQDIPWDPRSASILSHLQTHTDTLLLRVL